MKLLLLAFASLMAAYANAQSWTAQEPPCSSSTGFADCTTPGWADRPYTVYRPSSHTLTARTPVVMVLHGGTGNSRSAIDMSCPGADRSNRACWHQVAERFNFVVVVPNGTRIAAGSASRAWNSGGGSNGWQCVGGATCTNRTDDTAYMRAVLDHVNRWMHVNADAVFVTGLSNGASQAHRMACEMADRVTAIAAVGGTNQFASSATCAPSRPVAIFQIHGTDDPCWTYNESAQSCVAGSSGRKVGAEDSTSEWAARYRCAGNVSTASLRDQDGDGVRVDELTWAGCAAPLQLARIVRGGHTYPDGQQYSDVASIGPVLREWGAERIWGWFAGVAGLGESHLTGQWWTPSQSGWGLSIVQQDDTLVPIWYTYDVDGRPLWLIGSGLVRQSDGSYQGPLYRAKGVAFSEINNQAALRQITQVGNMRIQARGDGKLTLTYSVNNISGTRIIERLLPATNPTCLASLGSRAQARNGTDKWWNPDESGWGLQINEFGDRAFVTWYTYASDGEPMWVIAQLDRVSGKRFQGLLYRPTSGVAFNQISGPATTFPLPTVGSLTLTFIDGQTARFDYTMDGVTRQRSIKRFEFDGPTRTECN